VSAATVARGGAEGLSWQGLSFYRYRLPLVRPIRTAAGLLAERCGLYLRLAREDGRGWGEIAPLDGYSLESFATVVEAVKSCQRGLVSLATIAAAYPSVRCGLAFAALFPSTPSGGATRLTVARLLDQEQDDELLGAARQAVAAGFRVLKIKVGRRALPDDLALVGAIQAELPVGATLRLDANRRWSLAAALAFSQALSPAGIAFIEEPLASFADYGAYDRRQGLPFALDESLLGRGPEEIGPWRHLRALVLKPSLLGGPEVCRAWAAWAAGRGLEVVPSSMYETGLGMRALLQFAGSLPATGACGFDTYAALARDPVSPGLFFPGGVAPLPPLAPWRIDQRQLEPVG
jgi:o-succinylbenzoate synthase